MSFLYFLLFSIRWIGNLFVILQPEMPLLCPFR